MSRFTIVLLGFWLGIGSATHAEWPPADSWTDFRRGSQLQGVAFGKLPDDLRKLWEIPSKDGITSTPTIVEGKVYVGCLTGELLCLSLKDGSTLWTYRSQPDAKPNQFMPGFASSIAVTEELVFAGDEDGNFHAVDRKTGERRWLFEAKGQITGGPNLWGHNILLGSHSGHLVCLKQSTGDVVWDFDAQGPVNATPVVAGNLTILTGCDKPRLWMVDLDKGSSAGEMSLGEKLLVTSAAARDNCIYMAQNSQVTALDWKTKKVLWEAPSGGDQKNDSSPAVTEDEVIVGAPDKAVRCFERRTGQERWTFKTRGRVVACPVVAGDRVYVGSVDKHLYAISLKDGHSVWEENVSYPVEGSMAIAEGCLVVGTTRGGGILCFGKK